MQLNFYHFVELFHKLIRFVLNGIKNSWKERLIIILPKANFPITHSYEMDKKIINFSTM